MAGYVVLACKDHRTHRAAEARSLSAFEPGVAVTVVASRIATTATGATVLHRRRLSLRFHIHFHIRVICFCIRVIRLHTFVLHCKEKHPERKQQQMCQLSASFFAILYLFLSQLFLVH